MKKEVIYKTSDGTTIALSMKELNQILKDKGLDESGDVQQFHTQNVLRRIKKYMPFLTGATYKITAIQTDIRKPMIVTDVPYGKYLFYGKVMVNAKTGKGPALIPGVGYRYKKGTILKETGRPLEYTRTKNPAAGPRWDKALSAAEGAAMAADVERYLKRKG